MPFFVTIIVVFVLAALGIWGYFSLTKEGRAKDIAGDLEEAHLQNKFMDSIEETREILNELQARKEFLNKG